MHKFCTYVTYHATGKFYVGKGITAKVASGKYKGSGKILKDAFHKYPPNEWMTDIVTTHEIEVDAYAQEAIWVDDDLLRDPSCLNLVRGGFGWDSKRVIEQNAIMWQDQDYRTKMQLMKAEHWLDPVFVKKITTAASKYQKQKWQDPEYRAKMTAVSNETVKKTWKNADFQSAMSKRAWQNPIVRENQAILLKRRFEETDIKEKLIAGCKRKWQDPEFRVKMSALRSARIKNIRWMCKDGIKRQVPISELENYTANGWVRGMK